MRRERISCIYATIPPPTAALVGYFLALLTGARLILDFRDPWAGARFPGDWRSRLYDKLEAMFERLAIRRAFRVITTTERFKQKLQKNYRDIPEEKFVSIPNGFDADDRVETENPKRSTRFVISYMGSFYQNRNPETFFQALKLGIEEGTLPAQDICVRFMGYVKSVGNTTTLEMLKTYGLEDIVSIMGQVSHQEALKQMQASDLLLLFAPDQSNQIPGKAFEYIGARRSILAFTEEGATADLIRNVKGGLVVHQDDLAGILAVLKEFYRLHCAGESPWYNGCDISQYDRHNQTGQLATILETPA
jgi:glycosyltransferase involved in cell wall biosynthesis